MRIEDIPDLPARAKGALSPHFGADLADLNHYTRHEISLVHGVGAAALDALDRAGWSPFEGDDEELDEILVEDEPHALGMTLQKFKEVSAESPDEPAAQVSSFPVKGPLVHLALNILELLAEHSRPDSLAVTQACEMAALLHQTARQTSGANFVIGEGMTVAYQGRKWEVRTKFGPGEAKPEGMRTVALIPRGDS